MSGTSIAPEAFAMAFASLVCRRELDELNDSMAARRTRVDIGFDVRTSDSQNLLRRAAVKAGWKRFDEAATVPGSLS